MSRAIDIMHPLPFTMTFLRGRGVSEASAGTCNLVGVSSERRGDSGARDSRGDAGGFAVCVF
jgi:hypothetical protein